MWGLIASAAGGLLSAGGAYASAKAQKANLKSQAKIAEINADLARHQAEGAFIQGRSQIMQSTMQSAQAMGRQRAQLASRGGDIGYGSAAEIRAGSAAMREIDYNTLSANALRTAWGYKSQAIDLENQALVANANANAISPGKAAFGSLLTSAVSSFAMYSMMGGENPLKNMFGNEEGTMLGLKAIPNEIWEPNGIGVPFLGTGIGFDGSGKVGFRMK
ncbi:MAG: hypothetical protein NC112_09270 [Oxalobacter formigenes]|nr:hypothetical protein [Oxalobacter formigenes]